MKCPECGNNHFNKIGFKVTLEGKKQRIQCQECGKTYYENDPSLGDKEELK